MKKNEFSESEEEFELRFYSDDLAEINSINESRYSDTESDSDSSDIINRSRKARPIESDTDDTASPTTEEDDWISITEDGYRPTRINYSIGPKSTGPQISSNIFEPIQFFKLFFTKPLVDEIIKETNNYAKSVLNSKNLTKDSIWQTWHDVNEDEFWAFIGVILNMGTMPISNMQEYWSTKHNSRIPFFSDIFTRARFNQIFWMLHLKTPDSGSKNLKTHIQQASIFLDYIDSKFSEHFIPGQNISLHESIVTFRGKISFITYNPIKPTKWSIRIYAMVDSETGYIYTTLPYYGSITSGNLIRPDLPVSTRIPLHLYQKLLDKIPEAQGYHMFTDRYYTSIPLAEELMKVKCYLTAWKDKRIMSLLSTWNDAGMIDSKRILQGGKEVNIRKPNVVVSYTNSMSSINQTNQYTSTYCFLRKSLKWWRKMFFWGMEKPLTHLKYVKLLIDQLINNFRQERSRASTSSSEIRLNGKLHEMRRGKKRDCIVCSNRQKKGERHETSEYCNTCPDKPRMHLGDCFSRYHKMKKYKYCKAVLKLPQKRNRTIVNNLGVGSSP
ncbi:piggyBac transposable element-derived protein 4-like [Bombus impatiens]|uniref:PiggyBac transposable element-derived protein 4-like n=1 Tax=Bombus impatiens TaxID=132113 RepID=A0A6P6F7Y4_BOMIM|nr:piggyBac transposable element-derived protein 4-like [Bombus impatiens]